jgi:hypothetical protein
VHLTPWRLEHWEAAPFYKDVVLARLHAWAAAQALTGQWADGYAATFHCLST